MLRELSIDELVELRMDLFYAAQKVERAIVAKLSEAHRAKNSRNYTAEEINAGKQEIDHVELMLRGSVQKMWPTLLAFTEKESVGS